MTKQTSKQTQGENTHPPLEIHYKKHVQEEESLLADGFMIEKALEFFELYHCKSTTQSSNSLSLVVVVAVVVIILLKPNTLAADTKILAPMLMDALIDS